MDNPYKPILDYCADTPKSPGSIITHLGYSRDKLYNTLRKLVIMSALEKVRINNSTQGVRYIAVDGWEPKEPIAKQADAPYQPLGICVWGVWL